MYLPIDQFTLPLLSVVARGTRGGAPVIAAVRREAGKIDPQLPIGDARPFERIVQDSIEAPRFRAWMLTAFSAAALALASLGIYGTASTSVAARTRELGVRIALGANPSQMRRLILGEGLRLAAIGAGIGLAGAMALTRLMKSLLYGVAATDAPTLFAVSMILGSAVLLAIFLPARRAARINPVAALKAD
jgi:putative ABC transport system permease protein